MTDYILVPVEPTAEMVEAAREHHEGEAYLPVSLYKAMLAAAPDHIADARKMVSPAVQGEPVGYGALSAISKTWDGRDFIPKDEADGYDDDALLPLYAAPQPEPDVSALVEALEQCITSMLDSGYRADSVVIRAARTALATHRKGGDV